MYSTYNKNVNITRKQYILQQQIYIYNKKQYHSFQTEVL